MKELTIASIFYNQNGWHKLIVEAIIPFIQLQQSAGSLKDYNLYLSTKQGEHVSVDFDMLENPDGFKEEFLTFFNSFFAKSSSKTTHPVFPLDNLFMNYPNNQIFFNIEKKTPSPLNRVQRCITKAIINGLAINAIDAETIFTFILYLQLGIIKAKYPDLDTASKAISQIKNYIVKNDLEDLKTNTTSKEWTERLERLYNSNVIILNEIFIDIWNVKKKSAELAWLEEWIVDCKPFTAEEEFARSFLDISQYIFMHMGLNGKQLIPLLINIYYKVRQNNLNIKI